MNKWVWHLGLGEYQGTARTKFNGMSDCTLPGPQTMVYLTGPQSYDALTSVLDLVPRPSTAIITAVTCYVSKYGGCDLWYPYGGCGLWYPYGGCGLWQVCMTSVMHAYRVITSSRDCILVKS